MGDLDPHVYAVAEEAFKKMERYALTLRIKLLKYNSNITLVSVGRDSIMSIFAI